MEKEYIEVKIPVLGDVEGMETVKTFNQQQLWYICAIVKAYEKAEVQLKKQKEVIDKAVLELANIDGNLSNSQLSDRICNLIDILKEVSE